MSFEDQVRRVSQGLALTESEDTWGAIAAALETLKQVVQHKATDIPQEVVLFLRSHTQAINKAVLSERSRLSGSAIDLLATSATELAGSFEPLLPIFVPTLLALSSRPNKVFVNRARVCLTTMASSTQSPAMLSFLVHHLREKSASLRLTLAEAALTYLNCANPPDLQKESLAKEVETLIKATAIDANAEIRKYGRKLFDAYKILLPERVGGFTAPLSPTIRKYLDIRGTSVPSSHWISRPASAMSTNSTASSSHEQVSFASASKPGKVAPTSSCMGSTSSRLVSSDKQGTISTTSKERVKGTANPANSTIARKESSTERRWHEEHAMRTFMAPPAPPQSHTEVLPPSDGDTAHLPPPKFGPLRPGPTHSRSTMDVKTEDTSRRAGGAKRVLRPEPIQKGVEKLTNTKGPVRPLAQDAPVSKTNTGPASKPGVTKASAKLPPAKTARSAVGPFQQRAVKDTASDQSSAPATQPSSDRTISIGDGKEASSRLTKPTMSQLARESSAPKMARRQTEATKSAREHPKKPKKIGATAMAEDIRGSMPASLGLPVLAGIAVPIAIPLPPSPPAGLTQQADADHEPDEQLAPGVDKKTNEPSECVVGTQLDPSLELTTPKAALKPLSVLAVEQTPISALVDSIRNGFVFTPGYEDANCPDDDDGDLDSTFVAQDRDSRLILPLNWARRAASVPD